MKLSTMPYYKTTDTVVFQGISSATAAVGEATVEEAAVEEAAVEEATVEEAAMEEAVLEEASTNHNDKTNISTHGVQKVCP